MIGIQHQQLSKAISTLHLLGCEFAIREPGGDMHGTLPVVAPKPVKATKAGVPRKPKKNYSHLGLKAKVLELAVGDVLVQPGAEGFLLNELQANLCTLGCHAFGNGNFTTTVNKLNNTVECMRLA